jgi:Mg2+-importing ATPase
MNAARDRKEVRAPDRDGAKDPANGELGPEETWKEPVKRLLIRLATTSAGLDTAEAKSRLTTFGPNNAATVKRSPLWLQFLTRFRNPLVIILLVASGLSAATDVASFLIVVSIVTISITLDFVQEVRAQNAVEALRRTVAPCRHTASLAPAEPVRSALIPARVNGREESEVIHELG